MLHPASNNVNRKTDQGNHASHALEEIVGRLDVNGAAIDASPNWIKVDCACDIAVSP